MVDLLLRSLNPVRKPIDNMVGLVRVNQPNVLNPRGSLLWVARLDYRGSIEIETGHATPFNPAALKDELVSYRDRQSRSPGHLLHGPELIDPSTGAQLYGLAVFVEHGIAGRIGKRNRRNACVDAGRRPERADWHVNVVVHRHIRVEIAKRHARAVAVGRVAARFFPDAAKFTFSVCLPFCAYPIRGFRIGKQRIDHLFVGRACLYQRDSYAEGFRRTGSVAAASVSVCCRFACTGEIRPRFAQYPKQQVGRHRANEIRHAVELLFRDGEISIGQVQLNRRRMILTVAALELAAVLGPAHRLAKRGQIVRRVPEKDLRAGAAGRYLGVAVKALDDLARPFFERAVFPAAGIKIDSAERSLITQITEFDPDGAALAIHDTACTRFCFRAAAPGAGIIGLCRPAMRRVRNLRGTVAALLIAPSNPAR